jgi:hypothetical protein
LAAFRLGVPFLNHGGDVPPWRIRMVDKIEYSASERERMAAAAAITELLNFLRSGSARLRHAPDEILKSVVWISGTDADTVSAFERRSEDKAAWDRARHKIGQLAESAFERIDAGVEIDDAEDMADCDKVWLDRIGAMRSLGGIPKSIPAGVLAGWLAHALDSRPGDDKLLLAGEKTDATKAAKDARTLVLARASRRFADAMAQDKGPPMPTVSDVIEDAGYDLEDRMAMNDRDHATLVRKAYKIHQKWFDQ